MSRKSDDILARARAGDPMAHEGDWEVDNSARFSDREPEVLVSRSLRVSVATYDQVRSIAVARGMSPSALMRELIEDGVAAAQEQSGRPADVVSLLDRVQADVNRLAHVLRRAA